MKKKLLAALLLCAALVLSLAGCDGGGILDIGGKETECDFCGETQKCKEKTIWGEEYNICDDCQEELGEAMNAEPSSGLEMSKTRDDEKGIIGYLVQGPGSNTDKDLVIPSTYKDLPVIGIAREAFKDCKYLKSVVIPSSVTSISWYGYDWEGGSFEGCTGLEKVVLSDGLERLQYAAFRGCTSLKSIVIPGSVKEFGYSTFYGCTGLESVVICDGVEVIGPDTFEGCTSLAKLEVGNTVSTIGTDAFRGCTQLTDVEIKNEEAEVEGYAFYGCDALATVKIGEDITIKYGEEVDDVYIADIAQWCGVTVAHSFIKRSFNLYLNDKMLQELVIPDGIAEIPAYPFRNCISLTSVVIPDSVTSISQGAFWGCSNLTNVELSNNLTSLDHDTFRNCTSLTSITIPASVVYIAGSTGSGGSTGHSAFDGCKALASATFENTEGWHDHPTLGHHRCEADVTDPAAAADRLRNMGYQDDLYCYECFWCERGPGF